MEKEEEANLSEILEVFDKYTAFLENSQIMEMTSSDNVAMAFSCSRFVEKTVLHASEVGKTEEFMSHLVAHWSKRKRAPIYSGKKLEVACDKLIEVFMKTPKIPTDVIDKLLTLYVAECGIERLNGFLENILSESLLANAMLTMLRRLGLEKSTIEEEGRLFVWHNAASCSRQDDVKTFANKMIEDGYLKEVIQSIPKLPEGSPARKVVIDCLSSRVNEYSVEVCLEVSKVGTRLLRVLTDDEDFKLNYIDAIFYFGRHMKFENCRWIDEHGFSYDSLIGSIRNLMSINDSTGELIKSRILMGKEYVDGRIWADVEEECMSQMYEVVG